VKECDTYSVRSSIHELTKAFLTFVMGEDHEFQTLPAGEDGEGAEGQQGRHSPIVFR
jgi:hypothetical protein